MGTIHEGTTASNADYVALFIGDLLVLAAMITLIVFAMVYAYIVAWEQAEFGRYLMQAAIAMILVLTLPTNYEVFEATYPLYGWFRVAVFCFLIYVGIRYIRLVIRIQRAARGRRVDSGTGASTEDASPTGRL